MTTYFMSDPHFGHKNILGFSRPQFKSLEEHNDYLIKQINKTVDYDDTLYILGDIAFSSEYHYLAAIKCFNLRIVLGNHDYPTKLTTIQSFVPNAKIGGVLEHTFKGKTFKGKRMTAVLTHIPVHPSQLYSKTNTYYRYAMNIHGHLHQFTIDEPGYINVSMEQLDDFKPVSEQEILKKFFTQNS